MEIGVEWGSAAVAAAVVTGISGYIVLKARLGHEQRLAAEGALIALGPQIITQLNAVLAQRDARIDALERRNGELWVAQNNEAAANRACEQRCTQLTRDLALANERIQALELRRRDLE